MNTVDLNDLPANATLSIAREETAGERALLLFKVEFAGYYKYAPDSMQAKI